MVASRGGAAERDIVTRPSPDEDLASSPLRSRRRRSEEGDGRFEVPPNTIVTDRDTNETLCSDLARGARVLLCAGGRGGKGNGASGKKDKVAPPGPGAARSLALEMTLVADVGLVGLPNAGKVEMTCHIGMASLNHPMVTATWR